MAQKCLGIPRPWQREGRALWQSESSPSTRKHQCCLFSGVIQHQRKEEAKDSKGKKEEHEHLLLNGLGSPHFVLQNNACYVWFSIFSVLSLITSYPSPSPFSLVVFNFADTQESPGEFFCLKLLMPKFYTLSILSLSVE